MEDDLVEPFSTMNLSVFFTEKTYIYEENMKSLAIFARKSVKPYE